MWKCSACQTPLDDHHTFCWSCGAQREATREAVRPVREATRPVRETSSRATESPRISLFGDLTSKTDDRDKMNERERANDSVRTNDSDDTNDFGPPYIRRLIFTVALKLLGLFLLLMAFLSISDVFAGISTIQAYSSLLSSLTEASREFLSVTQQLTDAYRTVLIIPLIKFLLYFGAGFYLVIGGGALLRLLMRKPGAE